MYCFYHAFEKPQINNTEDTFITWCSRNSESDKIEGLDANKLANVTRYIMRSKKLTDIEIAQIKEIVKNDTRENDPEEEDVDVNDTAVVQEVPNIDIDENVSGEDVEDAEEREMELNVEELIEMTTYILEELSIVHTIINHREPLLKIRHNHKYRNLIVVGNKALKHLCNEIDPNLTELNELIYSTGKVWC